MRVPVERRCRSEEDERPVRFRLGGGWVEVTEILDRWDGENSALFTVRGDDGHTYVLKSNKTSGDADSWEIASFTHKDSCETIPDAAEGTRVLQ